ncbi:hypothetical protein [Vibrio proteolyticus]|uniref:Uncharacterized protein n=1 Tax=Vibrio proteolyticus NBRC 13287 TaxID=1219065 RepID=U2ZCS1_VIBPR|nr:hypothetical protein [Vibrio proteolyticus]GAD65516.1 hypothetical protein VPR01S_01_02890 [Vibrio proteolyticus NBRC 13287]
MANKDNYLSILMAQVECINEQLDGVKRERLSVTCTETDYRIEKILPKPRGRTATPGPAVLFQGQGHACHVFLNGYQSFFFTE